MCTTTIISNRISRATATPSSAQKRKRLSKEGEKPKETVSDEYILVKNSDIEKICKGAVCSECFGVLRVTYTHHQADVCITVCCVSCKTVTLDNRPESAISDCKNTYVVTLMLVYAVMCLGWGYSGAEKK